MYTRVSYADVLRELHQRRLPGVQMDAGGLLYRPESSGDWSPLESIPLAEEPQGLLLQVPCFEPEEGAELICVLQGEIVARSRRGFRVARAEGEGCDTLYNLEDDSKPVYADWLAGDWMTSDSHGEGPRGERLLFCDTRVLALGQGGDYVKPGARSRTSELAD